MSRALRKWLLHRAFRCTVRWEKWGPQIEDRFLLHDFNKVARIMAFLEVERLWVILQLFVENVENIGDFDKEDLQKKD